ncbi:MAG TPA: ABC transporter permease [Cyclobacteriaceae bacterium]|nr:ABC transporter permease [Cyclobacteriaceae bacterium]
MLKNYIKISLRALWKNRKFSLINIAGLVMGLSVCLLIAIFVLDELSYDRFHEKAERIMRLTPTLHIPKGDRPRAITAAPMGPALFATFPEIESFVRISSANRILGYQDKKIYDTKVFFADSSFLEVFTFPLLKGDQATALKNPHSVVLTKSAAKKYFGDEDALGKLMTLSDSITVAVTGVAEDVPENSHLQFDAILSYATVAELRNHEPEDNWFSNVLYTYVLLRQGQDRKSLESKFPAFLETHLGETRKEAGIWYDFYLQPLTAIHLHSDLASEISRNGNIKYVYTFSIIGILVLLVACANYINLSTAKSLSRAKEIGMRKVIGARRSQLISQLIGESFFLTLLSSILAFIVIVLALPAFNTLTEKNFTLSQLLRTDIVVTFAGLFLAVGVLAGGYPAFMMSAFSPIRALKSARRQGKESLVLRRSLVVFQFSISIFLIAGTIIIFRQIEFLQNQNLGLKKDQLVELKLREAVLNKASIIRDALDEVPGVTGVSETSFSYENNLSSVALLPEGAEVNQISSEASIAVDESFMDVFQIELAAGRNFSKEFPSDASEAFIVNETAVKYFNWGTPDTAVGKKLDWGLGKKGKVIGVFKDFNFYSAHHQIRPLIIHIHPNWYKFIVVKFEAAHAPDILNGLEKKWNSLDLGSPFDYSFMDEDFEKLYRSEAQTKQIVGVLAALAIFIACLGLLGLAAFTAEQRTKEIGIRKVLGANSVGLVGLLSRDFIKLLVASMIIALPLSWFALDRWLNSFAYKTSMPWWIFAISGLTALFFALFIVALQSIRAATTNPINSLRTE